MHGRLLDVNHNKFKLLQYGKEQERKSATTYESYDLNIDSKEQVRDLGTMISNTATFTLHIRNIVKKVRDKMGWVLFVSVTGALSYANTLEIYCHSPTRVLLPALESIDAKTYKLMKLFKEH